MSATKNRNNVRSASLSSIEDDYSRASGIATEKEIQRKHEEALKEFEEKQSFFWETPDQFSIRQRMKALGDSILNISSSDRYVENKDKLLEQFIEDYKKLQLEYAKTPYRVGSEPFKQVLVYENEHGDERIESRDGGKSFQLYEMASNGYSTRSIKRIESKDGKPTQILGTFSTDYTKRYFPNLEITKLTEVKLLEPNEPFREPLRQQNKIPILKLSWVCDVCKTPNSTDLKKCSRCGLDRKV